MRWINTLERHFGHLAIPGLLRVVVVFNILIFLLLSMQPAFVDWLVLDPERIMSGEVWRLVSYVFIPLVGVGTPFSVLWAFGYLNLLWLIGEGLEQAWGSFKLNLFYLFGMIGTTAAAFFFHDVDATGIYLNLSLFCAFATVFPNFPIMLFFVLPVRVKWFALASFTFIMLQVMGGPLSTRPAILAAMLNYGLFFGQDWLTYWREMGRTAKRQQDLQLVAHDDDEATLHHCKVCGRTEATSPELDFRVAEDGEEYCLAHLPSQRKAEEMPPPLPR